MSGGAGGVSGGAATTELSTEEALLALKREGERLERKVAEHTEDQLETKQELANVEEDRQDRQLEKIQEIADAEAASARARQDALDRSKEKAVAFTG